MDASVRTWGAGVVLAGAMCGMSSGGADGTPVRWVKPAVVCSHADEKGLVLHPRTCWNEGTQAAGSGPVGQPAASTADGAEFSDSAGALARPATASVSGPAATDEVRVVFVGDTGSGDQRARAVASAIDAAVKSAGASHLFLLGDNVYEHGKAEYITTRFLEPFAPVMHRGVAIHAALGNHDVKNCAATGQRPLPADGDAYVRGKLARTWRRLSGSRGWLHRAQCWASEHLGTPEFGYQKKRRYYAVRIPDVEWPLIEVFVLDSNTLGKDESKVEPDADAKQVAWLAAGLSESRARWRVIALHHPIYSPSRTRWLRTREADRGLRDQLEPLLVAHGVDIVFQGHQHLYARLRPQSGVRYIVTGAGSKKPDSFNWDEKTLPRADGGAFNHFVYVRATPERFEYCTVDRKQAVRDGGWFAVGDAADTLFPQGTCPALEK